VRQTLAMNSAKGWVPSFSTWNGYPVTLVALPRWLWLWQATQLPVQIRQVLLKARDKYSVDPYKLYSIFKRCGHYRCSRQEASDQGCRALASQYRRQTGRHLGDDDFKRGLAEAGIVLSAADYGKLMDCIPQRDKV
jgi:hypothetical protein